MKKRFIKIFVFILIIHIFLNITFLANNSYAAVLDIEPDFGLAPDIDGDIDRSDSEWKNATKEVIHLISLSPTDKGINVDLWVMQNDSDLYISIQFELEEHKSTEYIGILISESVASSNESFVDAKILQFSNLGRIGERYEFKDYYIKNNLFYEDREVNGKAAAKLEGNKIIYEFRIPTNNTDEAQDATLDYGETYAFKIVYGERINDPGGFIKSEIVLIDIEYPKEGSPNPWIFYHNILSIIIFCGVSALFGLYIYKIIILKKKMRRLTE